MDTTQEKKKLLVLTSDADLIAQTDALAAMRHIELFRIKTYAGALDFYKKHTADIAFIDIQNLAAQEVNLVNYIKTRSPKTEIIVLATIRELDNATYSLHYGASFYLIKPIGGNDLRFVVEKLCARMTRNSELYEFEHRVLSDLMGGSDAMQKMLKLAMKIAPTSSTVLIGGETGTGKEFFARIIHRMSQRSEGEFVAMNCGGIPDTLFESELFGHTKGAFTGADRDKPGLVEVAHMGTLFLDEVGELSPIAQVKLLRFLQEHTYRRLGDTALRTANVRVIAATNKNLVGMIEQGAFREDLYFRLNVFNLHLPPLRERKGTIPSLIRLFVHRNNTLLKKNINKISKAAEVILAEYHYPGNVRELENILEHAMILAETEEITEKDLPEFMFSNRLKLAAPGETAALAVSAHSSDIPKLDEIEKRHIQSVLEILNNNYTEAAKKLGISRSTLWRKIRTHHLQ